ncbi:hypothetical protein D3C72_2305930 [compost metagenome]
MQVAVVVVKGFEIIHIQHQQSQWLLLALHAAEFAREHGVEVTAVGNAGQTIGVRQTFQQMPLVCQLQMVAHACQ